MINNWTVNNRRILNWPLLTTDLYSQLTVNIWPMLMIDLCLQLTALTTPNSNKRDEYQIFRKMRKFDPLVELGVQGQITWYDTLFSGVWLFVWLVRMVIQASSELYHILMIFVTQKFDQSRAVLWLFNIFLKKGQ